MASQATRRTEMDIPSIKLGIKKVMRALAGSLKFTRDIQKLIPRTNVQLLRLAADAEEEIKAAADKLNSVFREVGGL